MYDKLSATNKNNLPVGGVGLGLSTLSVIIKNMIKFITEIFLKHFKMNLLWAWRFSIDFISSDVSSVR